MPKKPAEPAQPAAREVAADYHDDDWVEIYPATGLMRETARALLDTAAALGYDPARAVHPIDAGFRVPQLVAATVEYPTQPAARAPQIVATPLAALDKGATPDGADAGS